MNEEKILEEIKKYNFYHCIKLTESITTPGEQEYIPSQNLFLSHLDHINFKNKRVLDIGCRDGLFSFYSEKKGASEVIGIDNNLSIPTKEFLVPFFNSKVQFKEINLFDLSKEQLGEFDIILFPGVLYHLRYPFWGLKIITDLLKKGGKLIIETPLIEDFENKSILFAPIERDSPYERTSCTFFNKKCLEDTLISLGYKVQKTDLLKRRFHELKNLIKKKILNRTVITRSVFTAKFDGMDKETFLYKYWNETHTLHSDKKECEHGK